MCWPVVLCAIWKSPNKLTPSRVSLLRWVCLRKCQTLLAHRCGRLHDSSPRTSVGTYRLLPCLSRSVRSTSCPASSVTRPCTHCSGPRSTQSLGRCLCLRLCFSCLSLSCRPSLPLPFMHFACLCRASTAPSVRTLRQRPPVPRSGGRAFVLTCASDVSSRGSVSALTAVPARG